MSENDKPACVIVDIDHTISDSFWRDNMIGTDLGWDYYHEHLVEDEPILDILELLDAFHNDGIEIVGCTARPEKWRKITMEWMLKHDVPMDMILMRGDEDKRSSAELKLEQVKKAKANRDIGQVLAVLDDRDDVIAIFRAEGFTCLQVFAIGGKK
jgi:phosphoglycolate phosphatase-like HAD superfamily hydrolase